MLPKIMKVKMVSYVEKSRKLLGFEGIQPDFMSDPYYCSHPVPSYTLRRFGKLILQQHERGGDPLRVGKESTVGLFTMDEAWPSPHIDSICGDFSCQGKLIMVKCAVYPLYQIYGEETKREMTAMYALRPLKLVFDMVLRKLPGLIFDEELHNTADFFV